MKDKGRFTGMITFASWLIGLQEVRRDYSTLSVIKEVAVDKKGQMNLYKKKYNHDYEKIQFNI